MAITVGKRFGLLTVIQALGRARAYGPAKFLVRCDCGTEKAVLDSNLSGGRTVSCGCYGKTVAITHGKTNSKTYRAWDGMRGRCDRPSNQRYKRYGGRGITYDKRWRKFENFLIDMGECPPGLTLDRIDNNGNYCKDNCRWATHAEQNRNHSRNRLITFNGETKTMADWADSLGMQRGTLRCRLDWYGWSVEDALTLPVCRGVPLAKRNA